MRVLAWSLTFALMFGVSLFGCGRRTQPTTRPEPAEETIERERMEGETRGEAQEKEVPGAAPLKVPLPEVTPSEGKGAIVGAIIFEGNPPKRRRVSFGAEKQCAALHKEPLYREDIVVNPDGTLKWVLVYLKEGVKGEFKPPEEPVVIDQIGCWFIPHVAAALVGQPVEFLNSDPVLHNVRTNAKARGNFLNIAQPLKGMKHVKKFPTPEIGIQLRCDVHPWMSAYLHILPHPFFAITGEEGTFVIKDIPPGSYTIEAWHEILGAQTREVRVEAGQVTEVTFVFRLRRRMP